MRLRASSAVIEWEKSVLPRAILPTAIASRSSRHICCCARANVRVSKHACAHTRVPQGLRARLALVRGEPAERALLALGERDPVADLRGVDGVQQVLRLERQIRPAEHARRHAMRNRVVRTS